MLFRTKSQGCGWRDGHSLAPFKSSAANGLLFGALWKCVVAEHCHVSTGAGMDLGVGQLQNLWFSIPEQNLYWAFVASDRQNSSGSHNGNSCKTSSFGCCFLSLSIKMWRPFPEGLVKLAVSLKCCCYLRSTKSPWIISGMPQNEKSCLFLAYIKTWGQKGFGATAIPLCLLVIMEIQEVDTDIQNSCTQKQKI